MFPSTVNADGQLLAAGGGGGGGSSILMLVLMVAILVIFLVLPMRRQKKMRQQLKDRQDAMGPGTPVMTQFGVFATVVSVDKDTNTAVLEIAPGTNIKVHLQTVTTVLDENGQVPGTPEAARASAAQGAQEAEAARAGSLEAPEAERPTFDGGDRRPNLNGEATDRDDENRGPQGNGSR
ncbi:preprotein translocase subunit YajC [Rothia sp. AR01]|uniref:Preprotein translocase subunit YajC n=1 Tax=Rothia santali TaxID=2949643 RepID=A0A9X2HCS1_9MICC|nr:preprotein translocase subunit YajC [Rothia santali]MCP3427244.1 preprotein translocase subunit YajC [Rothia santali]